MKLRTAAGSWCGTTAGSCICGPGGGFSVALLDRVSGLVERKWSLVCSGLDEGAPAGMGAVRWRGLRCVLRCKGVRKGVRRERRALPSTRVQIVVRVRGLGVFTAEDQGAKLYRPWVSVATKRVPWAKTGWAKTRLEPTGRESRMAPVAALIR